MKFKFTSIRYCFSLLVFLIACIHIFLFVTRTFSSQTQKHDNNKPPTKRSNLLTKYRPDEQPQSESVDIESGNLHEDDIDIVSLPSFAVDHGEFVLGALIERQFESWNLHITTVMLCHHLLDPESRGGAVKVDPSMQDSWAKAVFNIDQISYSLNGQRNEKPGFHCRLRNSARLPSYLVEGIFVPNRLTADSNGNRKLDILRCPVQDSQSAYVQLARSNEDIFVEILRNGHSIINFTIPWDTRKTGFMLSVPPIASKYDGWKGFDAKPYSASPRKPFASLSDDVHVCVPGTRRYPTKDVIPLFLEFVSHHLLLEADHIYLPVSMGWNSPHMHRFLQLFQSYIDGGRLSIISHSGDGIDMVTSVAGMSWDRMFLKVMQVNMCLYESKGVADYVVVLDIDEFFIPRPGFATIASVLRAVDAPSPLPLHPAGTDLEMLSKNWTGGPGWADGDAHPLCFMLIESDVLLTGKRLSRDSGTNGDSSKSSGSSTRSSRASSANQLDELHPWLGALYSHGPELRSSGASKRFAYSRAILPTRVIYQGALSMAGACVLEARWSGCNNSGGGLCGTSDGILRKDEFQMSHNFFETVLRKDAKVVNSASQAVIYHYRYYDSSRPSPEAERVQSQYASSFFPSVANDLYERNLHLAVIIPDSLQSIISDSTAGSDGALSSFVTSGAGAGGVGLTITTIEKDWLTPFTADTVQELNKIRQASAKKAPPVASIVPPRTETVLQVIHFNQTLRTQQHFVDLPNFAVDFSEYALSSLIERVSGSFDLWLSTFFVSHKLSQRTDGGLNIYASEYDLWNRVLMRFKSTKYYDSGERQRKSIFLCRISHKNGQDSYVTPGHFVPNNLSPAKQDNGILDIFRCKMKDTELAYMNLARSDEVMEVEILRDDVSILAFRVPWKTRSTGFMISAPKYASKLDPWHGFDKETPGVWHHDNLYMCVPGMDAAPSKESLLPIYLEFIQHHLLLGVDHIIIGALFGWESIHMKRLLRVLKSYIDANQVSVISTSGDGFDGIYSSTGMDWGQQYGKYFHVNMCSYAAKGMASYVAVWNFDEFFLPLDSIASASANGSVFNTGATGASSASSADGIILRAVGLGRGVTGLSAAPSSSLSQSVKPNGAVADDHPFCYIQLTSVATLHASLSPGYSVDSPWIGQHYRHSPELVHQLAFSRTIRPTHAVFLGGMQQVGTCRMPFPFSGCDKEVEFCFSSTAEMTTGPSLSLLSSLSSLSHTVSSIHRFDEAVEAKDARHVLTTEAVLNHFVLDDPLTSPGVVASSRSLQTTSIYATQYFPSVLEALDSRHLVLPLTLPEAYPKPFPPADEVWVDFEVMRKDIITQLVGTPSTAGIDLGVPAIAGKGIQLLPGRRLQEVAGVVAFVSSPDIMSQNSTSSSSQSSIGTSIANSTSASTSTSVSSSMSRSFPSSISSTKSISSSSSISNSTSTSLPAWAADLSEIFLGAIIERVSDSWDLHLTTFMLCHNMIEYDPNGYAAYKSKKEAVATWKTAIPRLRAVNTTNTGVRIPHDNFFCKIRNAETWAEYLVPAVLLPNRVTPDVNANNRLDIIRCKLQDSHKAYMELARSPYEKLQVEIIRDSTPLISFQVPWASRVNGKTLEIPPSAGASRFDVWKGFDKTKPGVWTHDQIHMCVPGVDIAPSRKSIPVFLEFVQHHVSIGIDHVHLTVPFHWGSEHMARYLRILRSYVDETLVSVTSHSTEEMDFIYTFLDASWDRDACKVFQVNMCTYLAKGVADYVGIWDVDEFFIPKGDFNTIGEVLTEISLTDRSGDKMSTTLSANSMNSFSRGFADGERHPLCYLKLSTEVIADPAGNPYYDMTKPWIGERFSHGIETVGSRVHNQFSFKKSIIPTRRMFQMGLHMSGACRLDYPWNGCTNASDDLCFLRGVDPRRDLSKLRLDRAPRRNHYFDEVVTDSDTRALNPHNEGAIYHFMVYRFYHSVVNKNVLQGSNDYVKRFFNQTIHEIRRRNLDLLVLLPKTVDPLPIDKKWIAYNPS